MKRPVRTGLLVLLAGWSLTTTACNDPSNASPPQQPAATNGVSSPPRLEKASEFRLARPPIGLLQPTSDVALVQVRFRMNRALPRDEQGAKADVLIGEAGPDAPIGAVGNASHHCYAAVIPNDFDEPVLRGAKVGDMVPLLIRVRRAGRTSEIRESMRLRGTKASLSPLSCGSRSRR